MNWLGILLILVILGGAAWGLRARDFPRLGVFAMACLLSLALSAFLIDLFVTTWKSEIIILSVFFFLQVVLLHATGALRMAQSAISKPPKWLNSIGSALAGATTIAIICSACLMVVYLWSLGMVPSNPETYNSVVDTILAANLGTASREFFYWLKGIQGIAVFFIVSVLLTAMVIRGRQVIARAAITLIDE